MTPMFSFQPVCIFGQKRANNFDCFSSPGNSSSSEKNGCRKTLEQTDTEIETKINKETETEIESETETITEPETETEIEIKTKTEPETERETEAASDYISHLEKKEKGETRSEEIAKTENSGFGFSEPDNSSFSFSRWGGQLLQNAKTRLIDWKKDQVFYNVSIVRKPIVRI